MCTAPKHVEPTKVLKKVLINFYMNFKLLLCVIFGFLYVNYFKCPDSLVAHEDCDKGFLKV
jgi:hypothetical protein